VLLTALVVVVAGRWRRRTEVALTAKAVLAVITSFTLGHSLTLIASALGWVSVPTRPVEVVIASSVAVATVHAIRPLRPGSETLIAGGFGLVHGLAFAGILVDCGYTGPLSLVTLLAFNVGVELAQLVVTLALFPSLYLLARTPWYPAARMAGGAVALLFATSWIVECVSSLAARSRASRTPPSPARGPSSSPSLPRPPRLGSPTAGLAETGQRPPSITARPLTPRLPASFICGSGSRCRNLSRCQRTGPQRRPPPGH